MEQLPNGFTLQPSEECFPLSTDSMILAHFTALPKNARVLDLGSGCGTLGLLLCARDSGCRITGVEIQEQSHRAALENISQNQISGRMESICTDLRKIPEIFPAGSFSCCVSNPPYFDGGPASAQTPLARREDLCSLPQLLESAAWALKYGGDLFLVHRPERLADIIARAGQVRLEAKRLLLVRHSPGKPFSIVALQLRKGGRPGLKIEEACLFDSSGLPTPFYKSVYHLE